MSARIVLVGAGHAHLHVARAAGELVRRGARVVLVDPGVFWYSGLATGVLGGMFPPALDQIDPRPLIENAGGTFVRDRVVAFDPLQRTLRLASGDTLGWDFLSLNLGSEVAIDRFEGAERTWTVKPISRLGDLRRRLEERFRTERETRVVVIGGGPTGSEVAANCEALARRSGRRARVTLLTRSARLLEGHPPGAARSLEHELDRRGLEVRVGTEIVAFADGRVLDVTGRVFRAEEVVLATGLRAPAWLPTTGLALDRDGSLRVHPELRSIDDERVFAAGDCASIEGYERPRLGVFGVRAAPLLLRNLIASLEGRALAGYHPQKRWLYILNLGPGSALAIRGRRWWKGRLSLWLKNRIDLRFLDSYR